MEIQVAVPASGKRILTYESPIPVKPGCRVVVPLGKRAVVGVTVTPSKAQNSEKKDFAIKPVGSVVDPTPIFSEKMLELAQWVAAYYAATLGDVLKTMLPGGTKTKLSIRYSLTSKGLAFLSDRFDARAAALRTVFTEGNEKKEFSRAILNKALAHLRFDEFSKLTAADLVRQKILKRQKTPILNTRPIEENSSDESVEKTSDESKQRVLTHDQQTVFDTICSEGVFLPERTPKKPFLLRGVTGSGKTEVFMQVMAKVLFELDRGISECAQPQCLVMVPEISLTPQMTALFKERFGKIVAVVHSSMSSEKRWRELEKIRNGEARVLIGPRSAVFGPFQNLKLIVVDEEHDASYKQQSGVLYHARDTAVVRAMLEDATVILASATPSLESYQNALIGKYQLVELPRRVEGASLPTVSVIESPALKNRPINNVGALFKTENSSELGTSDEIFAPETLEKIEKNFLQGRQTIIVVNRRGFSHYLFSVTERKAISCPNCSVSLTLHRRGSILKCHYCLYESQLTQILDEKNGGVFVPIGVGTEKVEMYLRKKLPTARIARLDSDNTAKQGVLTDTLAAFREEKIDILVGTQMLAKGHDFPKVTLVVLLDVDQALDFPDIRAAERTFQLIVQASGRAGRGKLSGEVLMQVRKMKHPVLEAALAHDYLGFAHRELSIRRACRFPPFERMIHVEFSSTNPDRLQQLSDAVLTWMNRAARSRPDWLKELRVIGPMSPSIEIIRGQHRRHMIIVGKSSKILHAFTEQLSVDVLNAATSVQTKIDVDPLHLN